MTEEIRTVRMHSAYPGSLSAAGTLETWAADQTRY
jgi:hypothetical protein